MECIICNLYRIKVMLTDNLLKKIRLQKIIDKSNASVGYITY